MKKYYKVLDLEISATLEQVTKKYNELSKEFDPANQTDDLKEFFIAEQKKLDEAFEKISSSISKDDPISDDIIDENNNEDLFVKENVIKSHNKDNTSNLEDISVSSDDITNNISSVKSKQVLFNNVLLVVIAVGVWGLFMQNMGLFVPNDDFTQKVRVVNTVDTEVQNSVNVNGAVDVYNTVSVSIDEVLGSNGKKYYYNNR